MNEPDLKIDLIACSDGVTVAVQKSKNILYIFNDYKCKRLFYIKELNSQLKKIRVIKKIKKVYNTFICQTKKYNK